MLNILMFVALLSGIPFCAVFQEGLFFKLPTEHTVIAERMPAMIFVLMLFFFMVISPLWFFPCRYLDCGYIITEKIALAYMQNTPGL